MFVFAAIFAGVTTTLYGCGESDKSIPSPSEVQEAQSKWGRAIVEIGQLDLQGGDFQKRAEELVDTLYAFNVTDVLFKPTMAEDKPFRTTREGAVSYFVANAEEDFPEDVTHGGFARKDWKAVRFEVAGNWYGPGAALSMGHYIFTDQAGSDHTAEFSFAYVRDSDSNLRIALHHSSFPFCGEEWVTNKPCTLDSKVVAELAASLRSPPVTAVQQRPVQMAAVSNSGVNEAQTLWGNGVVDLGAASDEAVHDEAVDFVDRSYAYSTAKHYSAPAPWTGPGCLFKPTKARKIPFRTTLAGGVSYFVGHDEDFAEDHGFALQPWTKVRFENVGIAQLGNALTVSMGHYFFTDTGGVEHKAEFTMAFVEDAGSSKPLIALHHSSFPFCSTCSASAKSELSSIAAGSGSRLVTAGTGWFTAIAAGVVAASFVGVAISKKQGSKVGEPLLKGDASF